MSKKKKNVNIIPFDVPFLFFSDKELECLMKHGKADKDTVKALAARVYAARKLREQSILES